MSDTTLTLADGTVIDTQTGRRVRNNGVPNGYVAVPSAAEAIREVTQVRRRLSDLPEVPAKMNIVSAVAAYYMFGINDHEIAYALGCTESQVANIKMTEAFGQLVDTMTRNIVEGFGTDARMMIEQHAPNAAQRVIELMDSNDEHVAMVASKDVLDRSGHRPADVVEHRHKVEGGLTIEYVRKGKDDDKVPTLDVTPIQE